MGAKPFLTTYRFGALHKSGLPIFKAKLDAVSRTDLLYGGKNVMQDKFSQVWVGRIDAYAGKVFPTRPRAICILTNSYHLIVSAINCKPFAVCTACSLE